MDLKQLRQEIDHIDDQLVALFVQRMEVSARIADYKKEHDLPIFVPSREQEKLLDVSQKAGPDMAQYTRVLYSMLFELSRGYQSQRNAARTALYESISRAIAATSPVLPKNAPIACLSADENTRLLYQKRFQDAPLLPFKTTNSVLCAVKEGLCRYGILPLENNKYLYDRLAQLDLYIVRAFCLGDQPYLCISAQLEIYPGADRSSIRMALSDHPGALYKVLSRLYTLGISVVRVDSQPIAGSSFQAMFYFDLETSVYSEEFVLLICELGDLCQDFAYLGSYTEVV